MATKEELLADKRLVSVTNLTKYTEGLKNYLKETPYIEGKHLKTRGQNLETFDFNNTNYRVKFEMADVNQSPICYMSYDLGQANLITWTIRNKNNTYDWKYKLEPPRTANNTETIATQEWANKRFIDVSNYAHWSNNKLIGIEANLINSLFNTFRNAGPNNFSYYGIYAVSQDYTKTYYYFTGINEREAYIKFISYDGVYTLHNDGAVEYIPFADIH